MLKPNFAVLLCFADFGILASFSSLFWYEDVMVSVFYSQLLHAKGSLISKMSINSLKIECKKSEVGEKHVFVSVLISIPSQSKTLDDK